VGTRQPACANPSFKNPAQRRSEACTPGSAPRPCSPPSPTHPGQAFVDFDAPDEAARALREKDHKVFHEKFGDRYVRLIQVSRKEMQATLALRFGGEGILKVKGIPFKASSNDVRKFFSGYKIKPDGVSFIMHQDGRPTGMAFIEFETPQEAVRAMDKDRAKFGPEYGDRFCMLQLVGRHEMDKVTLQRESESAGKMMVRARGGRLGRHCARGGRCFAPPSRQQRAACSRERGRRAAHTANLSSTAHNANHPHQLATQPQGGMGGMNAAMSMLQSLLSNPANLSLMMAQSPWMAQHLLASMGAAPPTGTHGGPHLGHGMPPGGAAPGSMQQVDPGALAAAQFGQQLGAAGMGNIAGALNGLSLGQLHPSQQQGAGPQGPQGGPHGMQQHSPPSDGWMPNAPPEMFYGNAAGGNGMERAWGDHR
jgi:hypothetical protein